MTSTRTDSERGSKTGRSSPSASDRETARLARAIGHPARVAIVRLLAAKGECNCGVLVDELQIGRASCRERVSLNV